MIKLQDILEYIYFRMYKYYYKWDNEFAGISTLISYAFVLFLTFFYPTVYVMLKYKLLMRSDLRPLIWTGTFTLLGLLLLFTYIKFFKRYKQFSNKWLNEEKTSKKLKGWVVFLYILLLVFFPLLLVGDWN
jgi:hypothetical protein